MTEKEIKSMNYEELKAYADSLNVTYPENVKKAVLQELVIKAVAEIEKEAEPKTPQVIVSPELSAFDRELERRKGSSRPSSAFENELARRMGKKQSARTFEEELEVRKAKALK